MCDGAASGEGAASEQQQRSTGSAGGSGGGGNSSAWKGQGAKSAWGAGSSANGSVWQSHTWSQQPQQPGEGKEETPFMKTASMSMSSAQEKLERLNPAAARAIEEQLSTSRGASGSFLGDARVAPKSSSTNVACANNSATHTALLRTKGSSAQPSPILASSPTSDYNDAFADFEESEEEESEEKSEQACAAPLPNTSVIIRGLGKNEKLGLDLRGLTIESFSNNKQASANREGRCCPFGEATGGDRWSSYGSVICRLVAHSHCEVNVHSTTLTNSRPISPTPKAPRATTSAGSASTT